MNDREKHKELFENNIKDILSSEELTKRYIELYTAFFGKEPKCVGCSVKKDYIRLKNIIFKKNIKMESEKYILKNKFKSKILSYKENKRTIRSYGRLIYDDFAMKFIKYGIHQKLKEERIKMFEQLPKDKSHLQQLTREELNEMLLEKDLNPDDSQNKSQVIEALENEYTKVQS